MPLSQTHRPVTVALSEQVPSPVIRAHGSPVPGAGVVHWMVGLALVAGPPICSKQTSPPGHAHAAIPLPVPPPELPVFDTHAPGEHVHDGSSGGQAQPVPSQTHALSVAHVVASCTAHGSPVTTGWLELV